MSNLQKIRIGAAVAVGLALASTAVPVTAAGTAARTPVAPLTAAPDDDDLVVVAPDLAVDVDARSVRDYWTPERMENAIPLDLGRDGSRLTGQRSGRTGETSASGGVKVPRTTGKLFFTDGFSNYVCSAASIKTRKRNQAITAGHCVHEGDGGSWFGNFVFVPRYRNGNAPLGKWVGNNVWAFKGWTKSGRFKYDQAIVQFKKRNGNKLVDRIGGNDVEVDQGIRHRGVRIWGWPAESPYDGETPHRCTGKTTPLAGTDDAKMRCDMTGGSSGGPWILKKNRTTHHGTIFAVTSRRTLSGTPYLIARPFPDAVNRMIRGAN